MKMVMDVKIILVHEQCPECKTGTMICDFKAPVLLSNPPHYHHICSLCGHTGYYMETFPCQRVVPVGSLRKMTEAERDELGYEL